ncbi:ABC transporter ATP-binding protein [Salisediminibacterium beveridgei]|nr:ABC transporter ATP-binding protein [Salisediminibacterium beveridgei]
MPKKSDKVRSLFAVTEKEKEKVFYALNNISFKVNPGDSVGLIGLNGSGKSTLSNLIAEVTQPSGGIVEVHGTPSLIAISAGLDQELTGAENIRLKCLMHGLSSEEIEARFDDIVAFSELNSFINQPIKNYSSGMKAKLGFSIAVHTDPDILIIDEALSVGDETFSNKCLLKIEEFQHAQKTIFFVSHSPSQIRKMCNKVAWIHFGELKAFGRTNKVIQEYREFIDHYNELPKEQQLAYRNEMIQGQVQELKREKGKGYTRPLIRYIPLSLLVVIFGISLYFQIVN